MPRISKAKTWSLTYSPKDEVTELPEFFKAMFESEHITKCYAIAEYSEKWHIHAGFETYRPYNSDYKWWKESFATAGFTEPAIDIRYHHNLYGLVGGYCSKTSGTKILYRKGFTDEQLEFGKEAYIRGQRKQRIRNALAEYHIITPDKFDAAVGIQMAELGCDKSTAILALAQDGFAFARSVKGLETLYMEDRRRIQGLEPREEGEI